VTGNLSREANVIQDKYLPAATGRAAGVRAIVLSRFSWTMQANVDSPSRETARPVRTQVGASLPLL